MIDLHALANQPGYGKADAALKKAGMWLLTPDEERKAKLEKSMSDLRSSLEKIKDAIDDADMAIDDCYTGVDSIYTAQEAKQ